MLSKQLCQWFIENQRDLPWRKTNDPYSIWLSEVMLQQTTVNVVIPYYEKFLRNFPTVDKLANASEDRVLGLWSGLGYYSRAKNLHKAAKQIKDLGKFPQTFEQLLRLQGVGPYTAAAVASQAFGESVAVVDGNVIRVITRLFDIAGDVASKKTLETIRMHATELIKNQNPRIFYQALMELGATVCVPGNPSCMTCPIANHCAARKAGTEKLRPVKAKKVKQEPWLWTMHLVFKKNKLALVKSSNGTPWLKNSWVLPGKAVKLAQKPKTWDFKHSITKHNIFVNVRKTTNLQWSGEIKWVKLEQLSGLGLSSAVLKALDKKEIKYEL